ncbi:MAG TPA: CUB domain-containing protein, partial [Bacteroidia bacterium]
TPRWDGTSYSVYYAFNSGGNHQCFINNAYSLGKRFDVVNQFGIGGIGIWALSYDDGYTDYWDKIKEKFSSCGGIACSDTIFDMGGPLRNYYDNENYTYTIAPAGATTLSLNFSSFTTESTNDYLKIYDGSSTASTLLGTYSGTTSPGTINASGSALTLQWHSNASTNNTGWYAVWNCNSSPAASLSVQQNNCPNIGVVLNWQNSGNGWYADVTDNATFSNYWSKSVSNLTSIGCPGGFANVTLPSNYLKFKPNTTYYWRIRNGGSYVNGSSFTTSLCSTQDTNCTGTLYDSGGPTAVYSGNEDYVYTIAPKFASSVTINFSAFDLENGFDSLYIHNGTSIAAPKLAASTGTVSPGTVTASSGAMTLHFISDPFVNNAGFSSTWTCLQSTGINENGNNFNITISPNPFSETTTLSITNPNELHITHLKIVDLVGREIKTYAIPNGTKHFTLEKGNLQTGVYFINLVSENKILTTQKIIIQ